MIPPSRCIRFAALAVPLLLAACKPNYRAPFNVGLKVTATEERVVETASFKVTGNGEPVLSVGTVGQAEDCDDAAEPAGTSLTVDHQIREVVWEVVGKTPWDHPLVPGDDWGRTELSVVQETVVTAWDRTTEQTVFNPGAPRERTSTETYEDQGRTTDASYYGLARDEYLVKVLGWDLWNGPEDTDDLDAHPEGLVDDPDPDWLGRNHAATPTVVLVTKWNPRKNDVWSSLNGNFLYFFAGREEAPTGDGARRADRVDVYTTGTADPTGRSLVEQCLHFGVQERTSSHDGDSRHDVVFLDPGCAGDFVHQEFGTQWWRDNILVKAETTQYVVTIEDFGYEWYEDAGAVCQRRTSTTDEVGGALPFVAYTVQTITSTYQVDRIEKDAHKKK